MNIGVDIGNSNIVIALFQDKKISAIYRFETRKKETIAFYRARFQKKISRHLAGQKAATVIIASVVPEITRIVAGALSGLAEKKPLIVGREIKVPIANRYKQPAKVGADRLINALAAVDQYPVPLIIVDFGTAITFDYISSKKEYIGGIIVPGIEIALSALIEKTSLLPAITPRPPKTLIGRDTVTAMNSGIIYGYAALTDGLISHIRKKLGRRAFCVATGGNLPLVAKYCRSIDQIDPLLTIKGLMMVESLPSRKPVTISAVGGSGRGFLRGIKQKNMKIITNSTK